MSKYTADGLFINDKAIEHFSNDMYSNMMNTIQNTSTSDAY